MQTVLGQLFGDVIVWWPPHTHTQKWPRILEQLCTSVYTCSKRDNGGHRRRRWLPPHGVFSISICIGRRYFSSLQFLYFFFSTFYFCFYFLYLVTLISPGLRGAESWSLGRVFCEPVALSASVTCSFARVWYTHHFVLATACTKFDIVCKETFTEAAICTQRLWFPRDVAKENSNLLVSRCHKCNSVCFLFSILVHFYLWLLRW